MKLTDTLTQTLDLDTHHALSHLIAIGMKQLNNHKLNYLVFEKNEKVYYFEQTENELLRLFCVTSKKSFYLS